jgi:hypothetical protein
MSTAEVAQEAEDGGERKTHHQAVGHERAAVEDRTWRDSDEQGGSERRGLVQQVALEDIRQGDGEDGEEDDDQPSPHLIRTEHPVEQGRQHRQHRELALDVAMRTAPVRLGLQRVDRAFVKRARDGCRVHLPPSVSIEQRRVEVLQAERRGDEQDQEQRQVLAERRRHAASLRAPVS